MIKTNGRTGITRVTSLLLTATLLFSYLLIGPASGCGGGTSASAYSSDTLFTNWETVDVKPLNDPSLADMTVVDPSLADKIYKINIRNSGGGISGLLVKFPNKPTETPGFNYLTYKISKYSDVIFNQQKLVSATTFNETPTLYLNKMMFTACSQRLGNHLCTKGNRVGF